MEFCDDNVGDDDGVEVDGEVVEDMDAASQLPSNLEPTANNNNARYTGHANMAQIWHE